MKDDVTIHSINNFKEVLVNYFINMKKSDDISLIQKETQMEKLHKKTL